MQKNIVKKGFVIAVIFLFIAVSFQPVFAKDTIPPEKKSNTKELLETIKDLANNKEMQDIIQKSEIKGSPIRFQQLLGRLQKEIIGAIETNNVLNGRIKQLLDLPCGCEKDDIANLDFPIICKILNSIALKISQSYMFIGKYVYQWLVDHNRTLIAKTLVIFIYSIAYLLIPVVFLQLIFNCIEFPVPLV